MCKHANLFVVYNYSMSFSAKRQLFPDSMERASSETDYSSASEGTPDSVSSPLVYVCSGDSDHESLGESVISPSYLEYPVDPAVNYKTGEDHVYTPRLDGDANTAVERSPSPVARARDLPCEYLPVEQPSSQRPSSSPCGTQKTLSPCSPVPDPPRDGLPPLIKRRRFGSPKK